MIIADASVWIDLLNERPNAQADRLKTLLYDGANVAMADLTLTEVLQGIRDQAQYERTRFRLRVLPTIIVGGAEVAIAAAQNYRFLRARGITVRKTIDTLLATRCIVDGHALLFSDRDFEPFVAHLGLRSAMAG